MNGQPFLQSRSSANGFPHQRIERKGSTRSENRVQSLKTRSLRMPDAVGGKAGSLDSLFRDRLVYLAACKIGHLVEVHLKNGSVYSGIFHAADVEKDFGIILKMARLIREGTSRGWKPLSEFVSKPPSKTFIIPADELVQVTAKDFAISSVGLTNALQLEKQRELLTDSSISQTCHVDLERELKPWVPDENFPEFPELETVFDVPWKRGWDQFEVNETLFGVKSTFDEELYTTKLEKGPQMRELEEQALRIAREIESETTRDIHIAEERGLINERLDVDEETKYSSVHRVGGFNDSGYEDEEDILLDSCNDLTFGDSSASDSKKPASNAGECYEESWKDTGVDQSCSISAKHAGEHLSEQPPKDLLAPGSDIRTENQLGGQRDSSSLDFENQRPSEESVSGVGDSLSSLDGKEDTEQARKYADATSSDPSCPAPKTSEKQSTSIGRQAGQMSGIPKFESSSGRPSSSTSASSECAVAASASSRPGLSPSSSVGCLSSEKSTLNPNAKEFKLNPNAKSFKPSQSSMWPPSPISDGSFYYPAGMAAVPQMPGLPLGYGAGPPPPFGAPQPVIYPPQLPPMQPPQAFFPPNAPTQYPQQMMLNQPRQFMYMPPYQLERPHKGRE